MMSELVLLSQVICDIYDAAINAALWPQALASVCGFVGANNARMYLHGASDDVNVLYDYNCDPHFTRLYVERYALLNPNFPALFFQDVGSMTAISDLVPHSEMEQTRFYKEWIVPQGLANAIGIVLEKEATRGAFISMEWRGEVNAGARERMALLVPHLQRAVDIGRLFVRHAATERALTDTLDYVDTGVFLLAANRRIVFANASGQSMIDEGKLVRTSRDMLRAAAPDADRALQDGLRAIGGSERSGLTVTLSETPGQRWNATVLPLRDGARRPVGDAYHAVAAVFVRSAAFADPTPLETLAKQFGLTASEIRVVEAMLRISGLDAIAEALGISKATVKTHLNRIFRKTDARNQGDLIRLIAGMGKPR